MGLVTHSSPLTELVWRVTPHHRPIVWLVAREAFWGIFRGVP